MPEKSVAGKVQKSLVIAVALILLGSTSAQAASSPNSPSINLPNEVAELGLGIGFGHRSPIEYNGIGLNLELGYGLSSTLELRLRTGIRFGRAGIAAQADRYARPFETETYRTGSDTLANPEVGLRFNLTRASKAEIGVDARVQLPLDGPLGVLVGLPIALRLTPRLQIDTGVFIPIELGDETRTHVSLPLHLWVKLAGGTFVGPVTGVVFGDEGGRSIPFGVGGGTALAYDADVHFWLLFDDVSHGNASDRFGGGAGLYVTF